MGSPDRSAAADQRTLRRKELAAFLRARRESIRPESVNLSVYGRRRTPGLRREEVAMLAGIGVTWYTKLEMAHDVKPSPATLLSITRVLRLDRGETEFIFALADVAIPPSVAATSADDTVPPMMERLVESLDNMGVVVHDRYATAIQWNAIGDAMFGLSRISEPIERNAIVWLLGDADRASFFGGDWHEITRTLVGMFRRAYLREEPSAFAQEVYARLSHSDFFRKLWKEQIVADDMFRSNPGPMLRNHPTVGHYSIIGSNFHVLGRTDYFVRIIAPADAASAEKFARLAALGTASAPTASGKS